MMRHLDRTGAVWWVHEIDASHSPGARADRCLIFDCEGVVRRVWEFPTNWEDLSDDALWALLDTQPPKLRPTPASAPRVEPMADHPAVVTATEIAARWQALAADLAVARTTNADLRREQWELLGACRQRCQEMRDIVRAYTRQLKRDGQTPERALTLVKSAIREGLGGPAAEEVPGTDELFEDAVACCIEAYYAA